LNKDPAKKPTLKTVANRAGVSQMTASRALQEGAAAVSGKTRQKVRDAAAALGYVPNRIAGALASRHVNLVGVIVPSLSSTVFAEVLTGITGALRDSALQPVVGVSGYDLEHEERVIRDMLSWRPSGLIIAGLEHSTRARAMLAGADIPVVEMMDVDGTPVDFCVGISHRKAGRLMAAEITSRGYRKIGFIGTKMPQDFRAQKRLSGFSQALGERGLSVLDFEHYVGASSLAKGRELTAALHGRHPEIECIYYSSDTMCAGGLMYCLEQNIRVPKALALAGFNNIDLLAGLPVALATTDSHRLEIGRKAADLILSPKARTRNGRVFEFAPAITIGQSL